MSQPIELYRLWCGRKRYSPWTTDREQLFHRALRLGLAYESGGQIGLGPLTRIERGTRKYARSKTVPLPR